MRENAKETGESRLSRAEILAQMRTVMLAGQETTSNTLSWALCELARQPAVQARLRAEVRGAGADPSVAALEALPYLQAVLKEVLRFYPAVPHLFRQAGHDDVLPLARPLTTRAGEVLTALPIRRGLRLVLSVAAYNRCAARARARASPRDADAQAQGEGRLGAGRTRVQPRAVARPGQGAPRHGRGRLREPVRHRPLLVRAGRDMWALLTLSTRPPRLRERAPAPRGRACRLTFAGGVRSCIGWRFA